MPAVILAFAAAGASLLTGFWLLMPPDLDVRLSDPPGRRSRPGRKPSRLSRINEPLGRWLEERMGPGRVAGVERRLVAAGIYERHAVHDHLGKRATYLALAAALGLLFLLRGNLVMPPFLIASIWFMNEISINALVRKRTNRIETELPDFLDVVAVMLSAGLGFREALRRVSDAMPGPVAEEIGYVLHQLDLGVPRREAFTEARGRNQSEAFDTFVASLLQAEELGAPLSDAMIALAEDVRRAAAQAARKRAAQTTPRVSLVLTFVIVPASLALLMAGILFGSEVSLGELFDS